MTAYVSWDGGSRDLSLSFSLSHFGIPFKWVSPTQFVYPVCKGYATNRNEDKYVNALEMITTTNRIENTGDGAMEKTKTETETTEYE